MEDRRVAKRYAKALFNAAAQQNIVGSVSSDLATVNGAIYNSDAFRTFLKQPSTSPSDKTAIFEKTFGDKTTALTLEFIRLLIDKRRDDELVGIQLEFEELRRQAENVTKATVESSVELDDTQRKAILATITEKTGRNLDPEFIVNPDLMGGVKVTYGDYVLDGSVRGQLSRLKDRLLYDLLKQA
jgi:F-type H+-transporting ATPase subunit delta